MSKGLVSAGKPACPNGRAGPITEVFCFAKRKVDLRSDNHDINDMNDSALPPDISEAQFTIGDVVRHRIFDFRGVIFDVDPVFANSDEWYQSIPESVRPAKDQPFTTCLPRMQRTATSLMLANRICCRIWSMARLAILRLPVCSKDGAGSGMN